MRPIIFAAALFAIPVGAFAQVPAVAPPYHAAIDNPQVARAFARTAALRDMAFAQERFGQQYDEFRRDQLRQAWLDAHNPRRVRRAEAAAILINDGDCAGAVDLAERGRDDRMIVRINQVCGVVKVSEPTP